VKNFLKRNVLVNLDDLLLERVIYPVVVLWDHYSLWSKSMSEKSNIHVDLTKP
jgi:hypothetical protein